MGKPNSSVSSSEASAVIVFLHVLNGTSRLSFSSNAIYPCIIALIPIEPKRVGTMPNFVSISLASEA